MAQTPPDHNFYYPHRHAHHHHHHSHHAHPSQMQLPAQFRNPFEMLFDERTGALNYNYIRPYMPNQMSKPGIEITYAEDYFDSLVMRRPRRSRTTFTSAQIAELEQHFAQGRYLTAARLAELSAKLQLGTAQVKIWFKNRRRRCKILSDQQNNERSTNCDDMPSSPSMVSQKNEATTTNKQKLKVVPESVPTPNLTVLTPSPTPTSHATSTATTLTPHVAEHFNHAADAYNQYYYSQQRGTLTHAHLPNGQSTLGQTQNHHHQYASNPLFTNHHLHQNLQQQQQQQLPPQSHTQLLQQQSSYYAGIKQAPTDFNFNNAYYFGKTASAAPPAVDTAIMSDRSSATTDTYEPLTPKNDEHLSNTMCNEVNNGHGDLNALINSKTFHTLQPKKMHGEQIFSSGYSGVFHKQEKPHEMHDVNYQCTMDTLMHAYNNHRNTNNNAHFATYCFN